MDSLNKVALPFSRVLINFFLFILLSGLIVGLTSGFSSMIYTVLAIGRLRIDEFFVAVYVIGAVAGLIGIAAGLLGFLIMWRFRFHVRERFREIALMIALGLGTIINIIYFGFMNHGPVHSFLELIAFPVIPILASSLLFVVICDRLIKTQ